MAKVFISYRRDDTAGYSGRLYNELKERLGGEIFMDIDSIPIGQDFVEVIERYVGSCDVVIALIGKSWLKITDHSGTRRLDNAEDFVRLEVAAALKGGKIIIPALVQEADMPRRDELPEDLQALARKNAVEISDQRWYYDVERLIKEISTGLVEEGYVRTTLRSTLEEMRELTLAPPDAVKKQLTDIFDSRPSTEPLSFNQVREEEYLWLRGTLPLGPEKDQSSRGDQDLNNLFHKVKFKALCFSGEGMRSAVFGLGVLQALARYNLLDKFEYLSTVSGGGYVGGWLTAWIHRHPLGLEGVIGEFNSTTGAAELEPLRHLRDNRSFLRPKRGLLSDNTLMVFLNLRNFLLNWFVLIPLLLGCLMLPRVYNSLLLAQTPLVEGGSHHPLGWDLVGYQLAGRHLLLALSCLLAVMGIAYLVFNRPYIRELLRVRSPFWFRRTDQIGFLRYCLIPLLLAIILITIYWAWSREVHAAVHDAVRGPLPYLVLGAWLCVTSWLAAMCVLRRLPWAAPVLVAMLALAFVSGDIDNLLSFALLGPFVLFALVEWLLVKRAHLVYARPGELSLFEGASLGLAGVVGGFFFWLVEYHMPSPVRRVITEDWHTWTTEFYVWLVVPVLFSGFLLSMTMFIGLTSHSQKFTDEDREWWARVGAWSLIVIISWVGFIGLVVFGPLWWSYSTKLVGAAGGLSGLALLAGRSLKTPANDEKAAEDGGLLYSVTGDILPPLAVLFLAIFVTLLSLVISLIVIVIGRAYEFGGWVIIKGDVPPLATADILQPLGHMWAVHYASPWLVLLLMAALLASGFVMARAINLNKFSPHALYRDRIIRVFLDASRFSGRRKQNVGPDGSGPAGKDQPPPGNSGTNDINLSQITRNPLQVINCTVSYGERLEPFTFSPLHIGSRGLGYRRSAQYGSDNGTSLGTALSISSARVAGWVGSSNILSLVLSLFNKGQVWWLGNPGRAGNNTYRLSTPRFSVAPLFAKMLGVNDDQYPYVELSNGADFDGLGLYEMVARRVHYALVVDASYDPDFVFDGLNGSVDRILSDLGIPVELDELPVPLKDERVKGRHYTLGRIRYSAVDGVGAEDGVLIYIKPVVYGQEPFNVVNYAKANRAFPHERGGADTLSYTQFESYRKLGFHAVEDMCAYAGLQPAVQRGSTGGPLDSEE